MMEDIKMDNPDGWIVAYSDEDRYISGHRAPSFKEASKFASMLLRNGYQVHALYVESAKHSIDWDEFHKSLFLRLTDDPILGTETK